MSAVLTPELTLDPEEFLQTQGKALRVPATREEARRQLKVAAGLVAPAVACGWFPVGRVDRRTAEIGDAVFGLGRHADLLAEAREVLLAVVTIGPALDERSRSLQESGEPLRMFLLHEAGVFALGKTVEAVHRLAEARAAERGWGVGAELAPGQLAGWDTSEQLLFGLLLDLESIGVRVTDVGLLIPQQSVSLLVGAGPGYTSSTVHAPCAYCDMGAKCTYRH
jgi:hypothetical protein